MGSTCAASIYAHEHALCGGSSPSIAIVTKISLTSLNVVACLAMMSYPRQMATIEDSVSRIHDLVLADSKADIVRPRQNSVVSSSRTVDPLVHT